MKIKFNWGTGIVITTILFMALTIGSTLFFMNQKVELVHDNYYERELNFQHQVDKLQRTAEMGADVNIEADKNSLTLVFPSKFLNDKISGQVLLYRASSSIKDAVMAVAPDTSGTQVIGTSGLNKGLWKVEVAWSSGNNEFYTEKKVMVF